MVNKKLHLTKAFTLVEMMVSVSIFALMTAFFISKYGTFNQNILLTNLAYDVALTLRNAQSYGLNVKSAPKVDNNGYITQNYADVTNTNAFLNAYGVNFDKSANTQIIFYTDSTANRFYDGSASGELISAYTLQRNSTISDICVGSGPSDCLVKPTRLDITYKRPTPNAKIIADGTVQFQDEYTYAEITLMGSDGSLKKIEARATGQIGVCDLNNICR